MKAWIKKYRPQWILNISKLYNVDGFVLTSYLEDPFVCKDKTRVTVAEKKEYDAEDTIVKSLCWKATWIDDSKKKKKKKKPTHFFSRVYG